ncbi:MAG: succinate dehydrogenase assembly factor 2 [Betaproteobacteria bacterium]|nr:succinate dehydrogenase assembly factor 2 [Betaproteobacteria bacterium]
MTINRGKVRWQCRRSLLELDLVLARFLEKEFEHLNDDQVADFEDMLRCDDYDLWAFINGSKPCEVARWQKMIERLRQC